MSFQDVSGRSSIVVCLSGGLGNQLFQYAMGRALSLRNGVSLVLDLEWFRRIKAQERSTTTVRHYALDPFDLMVATRDVGLPLPMNLGRLGGFLRRAFGGCAIPTLGMGIYLEKGFAFDPVVFSLRGPICLNGYWQSYRYFDDFKEVIRREIGQIREVSRASADMLKKIIACDAICLHVRRGDYVSNKHAAAAHGVCPLEYYQKGLAIVLSGMGNPHCFVFSDDPCWVRENLRVPVPFSIVDINGGGAPHEDLWLMAACKRFVIANSSLSWWGAWLSTSPDKVTVAPLQWFADAGKDTRDLIPTEWIRI